MRTVVSSLIIVGVLLPSPYDNRTAGQNEFTWVYTGNSLADFHWSPDSRLLVFGEGTSSNVETVYGHWNSYDVDTEELSVSNRWPLQPSLTSDEESVIRIARGEIRTSYMFTSPDGRFLVYASAQEKPRIPAPLAISNRETLQTFVEEDRLIDPFSGPSVFSVIWAADSSAFVVRNFINLNSPPWLQYVDNYLEDVTSAQVRGIPQLTIDSTIYYVREVLDISANGDLLLIDAGVQDPETLRLVEHHLILWDVADESSTTVIDAWDEQTYAGAFCPTSEERVVYMNGLDLYEQEIGSSERVHLMRYTIFEEQLHNHISRRSPLTALFSPDAHYLMIHPEDPGEIQSNLYLDDLTEKQFEGSHCFDEN